MTTITIDRAVLEQAVKELNDASDAWRYSGVYRAFLSLRNALNAPSNDVPLSNVNGQAQTLDAQPVTWRNAALRVGEDFGTVGPVGYYDMTAKQWLDWALSAAPPQPKVDAQPEPVAFFNCQTHKMRWAKPTMYAEIVAVDVPELPLYAAPPCREWVSLTDDEIETLSVENDYSDYVFIRAIEQALKERNT